MFLFDDVIMTNLGKHLIHIVAFHATQSLKFEYKPKFLNTDMFAILKLIMLCLD